MAKAEQLVEKITAVHTIGDDIRSRFTTVAKLKNFDYDDDRGKLCPMAMHCAFPYIDILRYGGALPNQPEGTAEFCCSDADVIMVFKAEVVD